MLQHYDVIEAAVPHLTRVVSAVFLQQYVFASFACLEVYRYMRQNIMEIFNTKIMEKTYQFMRISHHRPYTVSSAGLPAWLQHGYRGGEGDL